MKQTKLVVYLLIFSFLILTGCSNSEKVTTIEAEQTTKTNYEQQVKELKVENGKLKIENAKLEKKVQALEKEIAKSK